MFQNIDVKNADTAVNEEESNYNKGKFEIFNSIIGQALTKQNLLLYLISFLILKSVIQNTLYYFIF